MRRCRLETEALLRVVFVVVAAAVVVVLARWRPARRPVPLTILGNLQGPGVFLFTSDSCGSCHAAREVYSDVLGPDGFTEHTWEADAALLSRLGVEEIPVATVIDASGTEIASFRLIPKRSPLARAARKMLQS